MRVKDSIFLFILLPTPLPAISTHHSITTHLLSSLFPISTASTYPASDRAKESENVLLSSMVETKEKLHGRKKMREISLDFFLSGCIETSEDEESQACGKFHRSLRKNTCPIIGRLTPFFTFDPANCCPFIFRTGSNVITFSNAVGSISLQ